MSNQYIDNKRFLQELIDFKKKTNLAKEKGQELPKMPEYLGKCFYDICENISRRSEFVNYSFRDEMVLDAYENCIRYWYSFNAEKSNNPFGYFSRTVWRAFVRRILEERKQQYVKIKSFFNLGIGLGMNLTGPEEKGIVEPELAENMYEFIKNYEDKLQEKKNLKKAAKKPIKNKKVKK